jgi:hypothetical protein
MSRTSQPTATTTTSTSTSRKMCDAGRFLAAWEKALRKFDVRHVDDGYNSPIRSYDHIIPARQFDDEIRF